MSVAVPLHEIRAEFAELDDPVDRTTYLIEIGRTLPPLDEHLTTEENRLLGCQARVSLVAAERLKPLAADKRARGNGQPRPERKPLLPATIVTGQPEAASPIDVEVIRRDFPILQTILSDGCQLVYLDNAASTQRPKQVIDAMVEA